jgi:hypothetical protein
VLLAFEGSPGAVEVVVAPPARYRLRRDVDEVDQGQHMITGGSVAPSAFYA